MQGRVGTVHVALCSGQPHRLVPTQPASACVPPGNSCTSAADLMAELETLLRRNRVIKKLPRTPDGKRTGAGPAPGLFKDGLGTSPASAAVVDGPLPGGHTPRASRNLNISLAGADRGPPASAAWNATGGVPWFRGRTPEVLLHPVRYPQRWASVPSVWTLRRSRWSGGCSTWRRRRAPYAASCSTCAGVQVLNDTETICAVLVRPIRCTHVLLAGA